MPKTKAPAKAPVKAREKRAPFTPAEDAAILAAAAEGKTNEEIADMLGRKLASVWKRRKILARGNPPPSPRPYTPKEDYILLHQRSSGVGFPDIGKMLGRSTESLRCRYKFLLAKKAGLPPREYQNRRFTPEEDETIISMANEGIGDLEISKRLGRHLSSVRSRHRLLSSRGDLPPRQLSRKCFSPVEDEAILTGNAAGLTNREIAQKINRDIDSVRARRKRLLARQEEE